MPDKFPAWSVEQRILSRVGAGGDFLQSLLKQLERFAWPERDRFGIRLAVEEALSNAIRHGNALDDDKEVGIRCRVTQDKFWIEITDQGAGFDVTELPDPTAPENLTKPSGRGVLLIQNFMTQAYYSEKGNCLVMEKQRSSADGH